MPIKTRPSGNISFLSSYVPYSIGSETLLEDINEMFYYTVFEPDLPVSLEYTFGAQNTLIKQFTFKNRTSNAVLEVQMNYDSVIFNTDIPSPLLLQPNETRTVSLFINGENMQPNTTLFKTDFNIIVQNVSNGTLVYRSSEPLDLTKTTIEPVIGLD
jgi:hypothetical protein